jgi:hypothetical protein
VIIDIFRLVIGKERPAFTASLVGQVTLSGMKTILKFDHVILNVKEVMIRRLEYLQHQELAYIKYLLQ